MSTGTPEGWHSVTPRLVVQDPARLVDFLAGAFGATGEYRADRPSEMAIGDSIVMVSGVDVREPMTAFLYLYVDDTDVTYQRALALGAGSVEAPTDTPYGDRRAMIAATCGRSPPGRPVSEGVAPPGGPPDLPACARLPRAPRRQACIHPTKARSPRP